MQNFTFGIKFEKNGKHYYIIRLLEKYFDEYMIFDFDAFYQSNYAIFDAKDQSGDIISIQGAKILGFIDIFDIKDYNDNESIMKFDFHSNSIGKIFFIEGGYYDVYDDKFNLLDRFGFNRRIAKFGLYEKEVKQIGNVKLFLYPSKIINEKFLELMVNDINKIFPDSVLDKHGTRFLKQVFEIPEAINVNDVAQQLELVKPYQKESKVRKQITKKDFDLIKYELTASIENFILEKGGFDKIADDEILEVEEKNINYNIKENQTILAILIDLRDKLQTKLFDKSINRYKILGVKSILAQEIPQKLYQNSVHYYLVKFFHSCKKMDKEVYIFGDNISGGLYSDPIRSFSEIYEIYCFMEFKFFLEKMGAIFQTDINTTMYDKTKKIFLRYENDFSKGFLDGKFKDKIIKYIFGDKLIFDNNRGYSLFDENMDYSFLDERFKKVSVNGLTPDISLQVGDKLFLCDVKFSSFRDFDSQIDFPNPEYFKVELQKYKKVLINGEVISTPVILFYPGEIRHTIFEKFKIMFDFIFKAYNVLLFPIYYENFKNKKFNDFLIYKLMKIVL